MTVSALALPLLAATTLLGGCVKEYDTPEFATTATAEKARRTAHGEADAMPRWASHCRGCGLVV